jgi:hypothetical protein
MLFFITDEKISEVMTKRVKQFVNIFISGEKDVRIN